ncbi:MAG: hypothetical protein U1F36_06830 [Planctomycetota bacterium]
MNHSIRLWCAALLCSAVHAQSLVSPAGRDRFEGNTSTPYPLGRADGRFQSIHGDLGSAPMTILGHAYRADALVQRSPVASFATDMEVSLALSARAPDQASTTFASNVGAGATTVLPRTFVNFPTTARPASDPAPLFEFRIPYATPFTLPAGGTPLLLDVSVFGNSSSRGTNVNFQPSLDAHDLPASGRSDQPGYRFGSGCAAPGASATANARFTVTRFLDGTLSLDVDARDGVTSIVNAPAQSALIVGFGMQSQPWPSLPACTLYPTLDVAVTLPGDNDPNGDWAGAIGLPANLLDGQRFYLQIVSGRPSSIASDIAFSDGSVITVPPLGSATLGAVRIASGSDHNATTGTVARTVTVTGFF